MTPEKSSKITKEIMVGIFVSVVSGLILFFLIGDTEYFKHNSTSKPTHPFYTMLEKERLNLEDLEEQLSQQQQKLVKEKQQQSLIDRLFGGNETVNTIEQDIALLQKKIEDSKNKMSYLAEQINQLEKQPQENRESSLSTILSVILISVVIIGGIIVLVLSGGGGG